MQHNLKFILIIVFIVLSEPLYCQLDTNICYPLQIGNFWEYEGLDFTNNRVEKQYRWIPYDTILQNGERYFAIVTSHKRYHPNPFNNRTQIFIKLSSSEYVNVYLFDILGRKIKDLIINEKLNGSYTFILDSHNLSSGIYIIKVQTEKTLGSHKIIHLK